MIFQGTRPLLIVLIWSLFKTAASFRRVCYFTNWSGDLLVQEAHFEISDIDPHFCTHIIFAFAKIDTTSFQLKPTRKDDQGESGEIGRYLKFNGLKRKHPTLLTMLSVGGSLQANAGFGKIVTSEKGRKLFARNCIQYLRSWGFDGIDVDWEYPGDPPGTKSNFTILFQDIRSAIEDEAKQSVQKKLLMSLAAPVSEDRITRGYEVEKIASVVDFINLMAYDFHGPWNQITGLNAPLYPRKGDWRFTPDLNVQSAVKTWTDRGAPPGKIVVGIAGYGSSYTLNNTDDVSVGAPVADVGKAGPYRLMEGQLSYYEICLLLQEGATYQWDDLQKSPYVYINDTWVGFDDERSIAVKVDWMIEQKLGGVMFWSLDLDDFHGSFCNKQTYPLLRSIITAVARHYPDVIVPPYETTTLTTTSVITPTSTTSSITTTPTYPTAYTTTTRENETDMTTTTTITTTTFSSVITTPTYSLTYSTSRESEASKIPPLTTNISEITTSRQQNETIIRKTTVAITSPIVTTQKFAPKPLTTRSQTSTSDNSVFEVETPVDGNLPPWIPDKNEGVDNSNKNVATERSKDRSETVKINSVASEGRSGGDGSLTVGGAGYLLTRLRVYYCIIVYTYFINY